jgi:hypothetical protein
MDTTTKKRSADTDCSVNDELAELAIDSKRRKLKQNDSVRAMAVEWLVTQGKPCGNDSLFEVLTRRTLQQSLRAPTPKSEKALIPYVSRTDFIQSLVKVHSSNSASRSDHTKSISGAPLNNNSQLNCELLDEGHPQDMITDFT